MLPVLIFGSIAVGGVMCAAHSHIRYRRVATRMAGILFAIWLLFNLSYVDWLNPAMIDGHGGIRSIDLWSLYDMIGGLYALVFAGRWMWGRILVASFLLLGGCHVLKCYGLLERELYYSVLDMTFVSQQAVLFVLGGPRFVDRVQAWGTKGSHRVHAHYRVPEPRSRGRLYRLGGRRSKAGWRNGGGGQRP